MKAAFGVVSLLIVLAIVGLSVSKQLKAGRTAASPGSAASAVAGRDQAGKIQEQVADDIAKAMGAAAARASDAAQ